MEIFISETDAALIFVAVCFVGIVIVLVRNYNYSSGYSDAIKEINSISNHLIDKK